MKRAWDPTVLTVNFWAATKPEPGDGLETTTGRRYLIQSIKWKPDGSPKALHCIVLPKGEPIEGTVHAWLWSARKRKQRRSC